MNLFYDAEPDKSVAYQLLYIGITLCTLRKCRLDLSYTVTIIRCLAPPSRSPAFCRGAVLNYSSAAISCGGNRELQNSLNGGLLLSSKRTDERIYNVKIIRVIKSVNNVSE
jgi:hypothetical protein